MSALLLSSMVFCETSIQIFLFGKPRDGFRAWPDRPSTVVVFEMRDGLWVEVRHGDDVVDIKTNASHDHEEAVSKINYKLQSQQESFHITTHQKNSHPRCWIRPFASAREALV